MNVLERFWAKVDLSDPDGCWPIGGRKDKDGYGRFSKYRAPRYVYEATVAPIPPGLQIDHLCRNRACVNPAHLEPVTPRENTLRGAGVTATLARKTHCPNGHPYDMVIGSKKVRACRACCYATNARYRLRNRTRHLARRRELRRQKKNVS